MSVLEYRVNWSTGGTNPGVSVLHGRPSTAGGNGLAGQALADRARTFFDALKGVVGGGLVWDFPAEVTVLNTTTGVLEDAVAVTKPANVTATGAGNYSALSGARIEWRTGAIVAGRRLRGRTFVVPLSVGQYDAVGTLATTCITTLQAAATGYADANVFSNARPCVWSRTHGIQADITSVLIPDEASVLRSRRD